MKQAKKKASKKPLHASKAAQRALAATQPVRDFKAAAAQEPAPEPVPPPMPPPTGRAAVDWVAAGKKAWETRQRNLAARANGDAPTEPQNTGRVTVTARDASGEAYAARVRASIAKTSQNGGEARTQTLSTFAGRDMGGGWIIDATDGHRALVKQGKAATKDKPMNVLVKKATVLTDLTPELDAALRARKNANKKTHAVVLTLEGKEVTVSAVFDDQTKQLPVAVVPTTRVVRKKVSIKADARLLLDGFGLGGQLGYVGPGKPIVIDTPADWRYVLMPMT